MTTRSVILSAFGGPEVLAFTDGPTPQPGPGQVLVQTEVSGVNFGDTMTRRGEYLRNQPLTLAPGSEAVGRVVMTGEGAEHLLGRRVAAWIEDGGGYATHVLAASHRVYDVPEDLPAPQVAAVFLQGITAMYALHLFGRVRRGDTVLVHAAAGGVGILSVQLAVHAGAHVIGTASSQAKRDAARDAGAEITLDSRDVDGLKDAIRSATGGKGCDVVIDGVGGPVFGPSLAAMAVGGRYVVVGSASQSPGMLDSRHLLVRNQTVVGFIVAHVVDADPAEPQAALTLMCDLVRSGDVRPVVTTLPLEDVVEAHRLMESRDLVGKLVLTTGFSGAVES